jgi:hypothetical protein
MTSKAAVAQRAAFLPVHRAVQQRRGSLQVRNEGHTGGEAWQAVAALCPAGAMLSSALKFDVSWPLLHPFGG